MYWHHKGLHLEAEYLYKHYAHDAFKAVHAVDAFASYDIPTSKKSAIRYVTPLIRYDFMSDHSDGTRYLDGKANEAGKLMINDYQRSRLTGGVTLSLRKPFVSDIRLNYEKYFYRKSGIAKYADGSSKTLKFVKK